MRSRGLSVIWLSTPPRGFRVERADFADLDRPPELVEKILPVAITKEKVESGSDIDIEKPVSRQHQNLYPVYCGSP